MRNKVVMYIRICFAVLTVAYYCGGKESKVSENEAIVCKLRTNKSDLSEETVGVVLQVVTSQPLSGGAIKFSTALSNYNTNKMVLRADAFLDSMRIYLSLDGDPSLSMPDNIRNYINAPVLPARPYTISGWRIIKKLPGGATSTNELPSTLLQCNDPHVFRKATIEIPPLSTLVIDFKIVNLERKTQIEQSVKTEKAEVKEGIYKLKLTTLLGLQNEGFMRFEVEKPVTITVFKDAKVQRK
jgi:hypothetical protein